MVREVMKLSGLLKKRNTKLELKCLHFKILNIKS
jgi:hypothetical protein